MGIRVRIRIIVRMGVVTVTVKVKMSFGYSRFLLQLGLFKSAYLDFTAVFNLNCNANQDQNEAVQLSH